VEEFVMNLSTDSGCDEDDIHLPDFLWPAFLQQAGEGFNALL